MRAWDELLINIWNAVFERRGSPSEAIDAIWFQSEIAAQRVKVLATTVQASRHTDSVLTRISPLPREGRGE